LGIVAFTRYKRIHQMVLQEIALFFTRPGIRDRWKLKRSVAFNRWLDCSWIGTAETNALLRSSFTGAIACCDNCFHIRKPVIWAMAKWNYCPVGIGCAAIRASKKTLPRLHQNRSNRGSLLDSDRRDHGR